MRAALWFFFFFNLKVQSCFLFFHIALWEMGPQVHQKVFNIYSLICLTFFVSYSVILLVI